MRAVPSLVVAGGGAAGAAARWAIVEAVGYDSGFPWALLGVNTAGSLLLGAVVFAMAANGRDWLRPGLAVGFCGSFTTFSSFAVIAAELGRDGDMATAAALVVLSVTAAMVALVAGGAAARLVTRSRST